MDELTINNQENLPWCMLFAHDVVLIDEKGNLLNTKFELMEENI